MATSADDKDDDRDDDDEKDEAEEGEEGEKKSAASTAAGKKGASAKGAPAKATDDDEDEEEDDDEDEDEEEDEDEDEAPPAKPAAKPAAKSTAKPAIKPAAKPGAKSAAPVAKRGAAPVRAGRPRPVPAKQGGALGKSMVLFVIIIGGLVAAFAILGREESTTPKWKVGESVDLEITLVSSDRNDLSCAAADEVGGKHCGFEAQNKPWSKGDNTDDQKLLKPYTTVNGVQLLGSGMWSDAGMTASPLPPNARFSSKCKYKVEGTVKKSSVRWKSDGPWFDRADELYAGSFSGCKVIAPSNQ